MRIRLVWIAAASAVAATALVVLSTPGGWDHFRFRIGGYDQAAEQEAVQSSIRLFSASLAGLYMSAGNPAGLNMFPAEKMIKRRVLVDIGSYREMGLVLTTDRDKSDVREITFMDPVHAIAVVDEVWFMQLQELKTRRRISLNKANPVTVRYVLKKQWSRWVVTEFQVFGREDDLPPLPKEWVVAW